MKFRNGRYQYDATHVHAVSEFDGSEFSYDANGNQTERIIPTGTATDTFNTYILSYDHENRLISVSTATPGDGLSIEETPTATRLPFSGPIETPEPATPTRQAWPTPTLTPEATQTHTPTLTPTPAPTMTQSPTQSPTSTATAQAQPTEAEEDDGGLFDFEEEATPTATHTATLTPSPTGAATETTLPSPTATHTATQTATLSEVTVTATTTLTETATATITAAATLTPTMTASLTPTNLPQLDAVNTVFSGATYVYDGDGESILRIACAEFSQGENSRSKRDSDSYTYYVGGHYQLEVDGATETETKYYSGPTGRFAMRTDDGTNTALFWIFSDHLQSSSVILEEDGDVISRTTYTAFGEERDIDTTGLEDSPTDYKYTGQRSYNDDFGLLFFNARWYDPDSTHFTSADTIIPDPGNSGDWDRYAYVLNNPIRYNDPTGHFSDDEIKEYLQNTYGDKWNSYWDVWSNDMEWMKLLHAAVGGGFLGYYSGSGIQHFIFDVSVEGVLTGITLLDKKFNRTETTGNLHTIFFNWQNGFDNLAGLGVFCFDDGNHLVNDESRLVTIGAINYYVNEFDWFEKALNNVGVDRGIEITMVIVFSVGAKFLGVSPQAGAAIGEFTSNSGFSGFIEEAKDDWLTHIGVKLETGDTRFRVEYSRGDWTQGIYYTMFRNGKPLPFRTYKAGGE